LHNPPSSPDAKGFLWISLCDRDLPSPPLERFYVPLTFFENFKPINLEISANSFSHTLGRPKFYLSLCLEKQLENFYDSICTMTLNWVEFDPLPFESKYFNVILATDNYVPQQNAPFLQVDLSDEQALSRAFQKSNSSKHILFMSPVLKMPPEPIRNIHESLIYLRMPKSYLDRKLRLHLLVNSESKQLLGKHAMPNYVVGATDVLDGVLKSIIQ
jgi:hypothetical protein